MEGELGILCSVPLFQLVQGRKGVRVRSSGRVLPPRGQPTLRRDAGLEERGVSGGLAGREAGDAAGGGASGPVRPPRSPRFTEDQGGASDYRTDEESEPSRR